MNGLIIPGCLVLALMGEPLEAETKARRRRNLKPRKRWKKSATPHRRALAYQGRLDPISDQRQTLLARIKPAGK